MLRATSFVLAFVLGMSTAPRLSPSGAANSGGASSRQNSQQQATLRPAAASAPDMPEIAFDSAAEQQLLDLANQARAKAGAPPLTIDPGLSRAARAHAQEMESAQQLSHQFDGEPSLPQRLAAVTKLQLDQEGENVALDSDATGAQQHLMLSPPHRANLLNPAYNVVGLGVVRSGDQLYIVQDFGHALPNYSPTEVKDRIADSVALMRHRAGQPELPRRDVAMADDAACSMAHAGKLNTSAVHQLAQRYIVLTYTSLHPETLPANADHAVSSHGLRSFSVGSCYARTDTYPTGAYWVVLTLE